MRLPLALLFSLIASAALAQNPTCPTRPIGDSSNACASTAYVQNAFTALSQLTITGTPNYNLAGNTLAAMIFMPLNSGTQIVPASDTFNFIRGSNSDGTDIVFTVGANAIATGPFFSVTAASGSSASSNAYGGVFHAINAGPGNVRGAHLRGQALAGSTGTISAASAEITPVATSTGAWGIFASLVSSGVNGVAVGYGIETQGDTFLLGYGSVNGPVGYTTAVYRAWMATASGANARAFQTNQNDGTEIQYIKKTGEVVSSTALIAGTEANGVSVTQAAVSRTAPGGTLTFAAGTNAGNTFSIQTGGTNRLAVADTQTSLGGSANGNGTLALLGNSSGSATISTGATGGHVAVVSSSTPTANACAGFALSTGSSDNAGRVSFTSAGSCAINFGTAFTNAPFCNVTPGTSATPSTVDVVTSTTVLTATFTTAQTSMMYTCFGN